MTRDNHANPAGWQGRTGFAVDPEVRVQLRGLPQSRCAHRHPALFWCFNVSGEKWNIEKTCMNAKSLGCKSVEIGDPAEFPAIKKHGLTCVITANGMPGAPFIKGLNNPAYQPEVIAVTTKMIDDCAAANVDFGVGGKS